MLTISWWDLLQVFLVDHVDDKVVNIEKIDATADSNDGADVVHDGAWCCEILKLLLWLLLWLQFVSLKAFSKNTCDRLVFLSKIELLKLTVDNMNFDGVPAMWNIMTVLAAEVAVDVLVAEVFFLRIFPLLGLFLPLLAVVVGFSFAFSLPLHLPL